MPQAVERCSLVCYFKQGDRQLLEELALRDDRSLSAELRHLVRREAERRMIKDKVETHGDYAEG